MTTSAGSCTVVRAFDPDRLVVTQADDRVRVSTDLLRRWIEQPTPHVQFAEGFVQFGTAGEGVGVVTYEIDDPQFLHWLRGQVEADWLTMTRRHR